MTLTLLDRLLCLFSYLSSVLLLKSQKFGRLINELTMDSKIAHSNSSLKR